MSNPFSPIRNESTSSYDAPPADSASIFYPLLDRGDQKSLMRAVWNDLQSAYQAIEGGSYYAAAVGLGRTEYNYDQAEGWMPRITTVGTEDYPWKDMTSNGSISNQSGFIGASSAPPLNVARTGLLSSAVGQTCITSSGNHRVLKITNSQGSTSNEVYTNNWTGLTADGLISKTPNDGYWHVSWMARKASTNTGTVRMSLFMFGLDSSAPYDYDGMTGGAVGINAGSSTTRENPATGGTFYYRRVTLTSQWQYFEFYYKYSGASGLGFQSTRLDNDDGESGGSTYVYVDRVTLHPYNVGLKDSGADSGADPDTLDTMHFGAYFDAYD